MADRREEDRKRLIVGAAACACGALLLILCRPKPAPPAPPVRVEKVVPPAPPAPPPPAPPPAPPAPPPVAPPPPPAVRPAFTKETDRYVDFAVLRRTPCGNLVEVLRVPKLKFDVVARPASDAARSFLSSAAQRAEALFRDAVERAVRRLAEAIRDKGYEVGSVSIGRMNPYSLTMSATVVLRPTRWSGIDVPTAEVRAVGADVHSYISERDPQLASALLVESSTVSLLSDPGRIDVLSGAIVAKEGNTAGMPIEEAIRISLC